MSRSLLAPALAVLLLAAPASSSLVMAQDGRGGAAAPVNDDDAKALLARGEETEKSKLEDAVALYRKLLEKFPNAPQAARAHLRMGLCLAKLGKNEDARAHLRDARKLGKDDDAVQREAEKALLALPPPPEPQKNQPKPEATKPAPAPETGPRAELQAEIDRLEDEKRALTKKAQDLEDAGKTADAYRVRAELDKKVAQIEKKKKDLVAFPRGGKPMLPGRDQRKEERKAEKRAERERERDEKPADKSKLMLHRRDDLEHAARIKLHDALAASAQNRPHDAAVAMGEFHRLRAEAEQLGRKAEAGKDADQNAKLEKLTSDLKRRGALPFEIEVRVNFAKREFQLDEEHRNAVAAVQRDLDEKRISENEGRERTARLDKEHHRKIERLRDEVENRVYERGRVELEKELARRGEEMRKSGHSDAEVDQRIAGLRRDLEAKIPGRKGEGAKLAETAASEPGEGKHRVKELVEENKRLKRRVEELERENATLKGMKKGVSDASAPN